MGRTQLTIEKILGLLSETPKRIAEVTASLSPGELRERPRPDEWSVNDVLAHIRACADVRGEAIHAILAKNHPTLRAMDPRRWMTQTDYPDLEFAPSFAAFVAQRARLLATLDALPPEGWSRSATVTGAGKPLQRTVRDFAEWVAVHERPHVKQVARVAEALRS